MVNETVEKIKQLTDTLKSSAGPVSGETLAEDLGISRTAVWKIISRLKQRGYLIESSRAGYRLVSETEKPVPWELGTASEHVEYFDKLDSTMEKAAALLDSGCENGTTVIAGSQTEGVTREGGQWRSPDGGLYLTRIRTTHFPALYSGLYTLAMSSAVAGFLRDNYGIEVMVSWPGTLECKEARIGGLLTNFRGSTDTIISAALGIGLNIHSSEALPDDAAALDMLTGETLSIKRLTSGLLNCIESADRSFPVADPEKEYSLLLKQIGRKVSAEIPGRGSVSGIICGLHESGALVLESSDGNKHYIFSETRIDDE